MPLAGQAFASPAASCAVRIERLRRQLRAAEANGLIGEDDALLTLGIPAIDGALGGGFARGALHEIAAAHEPESTAAAGFALALAARRNHPSAPTAREVSALTGRRSVVWIAEDLSLAENGALYGPGLEEAGIAPEQLITVAAARGHDVLWAMEE